MTQASGGISNLTLDNIFEQIINGQTQAAQSMRERIANWRLRRLQQAQRTRLFFHELNPVLTGQDGEIITAYSEEFNQPLIVIAGQTNLVQQLVRLSDTVTNRGWSQEPVPVRVYAGQVLSVGGHQRFAPQVVPAGSRITGDFLNRTVGLNAASMGSYALVLCCYYIAPAAPPTTQQELEALRTAEARIKQGEPPRQSTIPATVKIIAAGETINPGETRPSENAQLITGLTFNAPSTTQFGKITIRDSSTNALWMKAPVTWWGVAGETHNGGAPVFYLPKPYYLPAGAILRVEYHNPSAAVEPPLGGTYTFGFVSETP